MRGHLDAGSQTSCTKVKEKVRKIHERRKKLTSSSSTYHFLPSPVNSGPLDGLCASPCGLHIFCDNRACLPVCPLGWMGETEALNFQRWQAWNQGYQRSPHLTSWCCKWGLGFGELYLLFQVHNAVLILIHHAAQFRHCFSKLSYSFPNWGSVLSGSFNFNGNWVRGKTSGFQCGRNSVQYKGPWKRSPQTRWQNSKAHAPRSALQYLLPV